MKIKTIIAITAVGLGVVGAALYVKHRRNKAVVNESPAETTATASSSPAVSDKDESVSEEPVVEMGTKQVVEIEAVDVGVPLNNTPPTRKDWRFLKKEFNRHIRTIKTGAWVNQGDYNVNLYEYPDGTAKIVVFKGADHCLTVMRQRGVLSCSFDGKFTTHHDDLTNAMLVLNHYGYE